MRPHVESVVRTLQSSPGTFKTVNMTPTPLRKAVGTDLTLFETLTHIDTRILGGKAHDRRQEHDDPYDAAFIEHLGHIDSLESVKLEASKIEDSWLAPLLKLTQLKTLSIHGFGRLGDASLAQLQRLADFPHLTHLELAYFGEATDDGWEHLASLKNLEFFAPRGARFPGHCFAKYKGWQKLKNINFHSNGLDDEGLGYVCENFHNLEFIKLWHSQLLTDASVEHLKNLKKLKGIEISCSKATAALVKHLDELLLEYIALEHGVDKPVSEAIESVKSIPTLRRLKLASASLTDLDIMRLAGATQLEELSLGLNELSDERLMAIQSLSFLKSLHVVSPKKPLSPSAKLKLQAVLPKTDLKFQ